MLAMRMFTLAIALLYASRTDASQCCFSGPNDCDSEHSYCSKDAKQCAECGGSYHETSSEATACEGAGMCCYSDDKDCDMGKHWCSSSADQCSDCGGNYICLVANEKSAEIKNDADDTKASSSRPKAQPVMLSAVPPASAALPLVLAVAPGKCCYSGPKDCDSEHDWCSKDASQCEKCAGTYYNATADLSESAEPIVLAAEVPKVPNDDVSGHCCYSGRKDCDGSRDWCSKNEAHCTKCGGNFRTNEEAAPSNVTAMAEMAALPLQLSAVAKVQNTTEEMEPPEQRQQREHRQQPEQPEQPEQLVQRKQQGDWKRFIPTDYRHFFQRSTKDHAHHHVLGNHAQRTRAEAKAFLAIPREAIASDQLWLPMLACLSIASLAMVMKVAVSATTRSVNLRTEMLG